MKSTVFLTHTVLASAFTLSAAAFEPDVVIDDADTSGVEFSPSADWVADTATGNSFRGSGKITSTSTANASRFARFYTTLPKSGPWQVFLWRNGRSTGTPDEATIKITHADTTPSNVRFTGGSSTGEWVLAGVYWFDSSKQAEVKILHDDTGLLAVDAVRFSFAEAAVVIEANSSNSAVALAPNAAAWTLLTSEKSGNEGTTRRTTTANATATFTPTLPIGGAYDVSIWVPQTNGAWVSGTMAPNYMVDVVHRGSTNTFTVTPPTSGTNEGQWVRIGTAPFFFDSGSSANNQVVIKANSTYSVPADAVRFSKVGTFSVLMDNDELPPNPPTEPFGVAPNPAPGNWTVIANDPIVRPWATYKWIAVGPDANRALATSNNSLVYTPALPELGLYDAYLWYPFTNSNTTNTALNVLDAAGQTITHSLNQTLTNAQWVHAGRYILDPVTAKLTIGTAQTGSNYSIADSVLFMRDGEEVDADNDGLPDWREVLLHTDMNGIDGNGDGVIRAWDTDNDGMSDGDEFRLGRNPLIGATPGAGAMILDLHTPTLR